MHGLPLITMKSIGNQREEGPGSLRMCAEHILKNKAHLPNAVVLPGSFWIQDKLFLPDLTSFWLLRDSLHFITPCLEIIAAYVLRETIISNLSAHTYVI